MTATKRVRVTLDLRVDDFADVVAWNWNELLGFAPPDEEVLAVEVVEVVEPKESPALEATHPHAQWLDSLILAAGYKHSLRAHGPRLVGHGRGTWCDAVVEMVLTDPQTSEAFSMVEVTILQRATLAKHVRGFSFPWLRPDGSTAVIWWPGSALTELRKRKVEGLALFGSGGPSKEQLRAYFGEISEWVAIYLGSTVIGA